MKKGARKWIEYYWNYVNSDKYKEEKIKLAKRMAKRVKNGETIGFGSGSTSYLTVIEISKRIKEENLKIKRYNRFIHVLIIRYLMYFNCVITPIERRNEINPLRLSSQFEFEDMCDLYKCSLYLCEGISKSSIESFYEIEEILRNYMIDMIQNIDFNITKN